MMTFTCGIKMLSGLFATPSWAFPLNTQLVSQMLFPVRGALLPFPRMAVLTQRNLTLCTDPTVPRPPSQPAVKRFLVAIHQCLKHFPLAVKGYTFHPIDPNFIFECLLTCRGRFSNRKPHTPLLEHCVYTVFGSKTFDLLTTKAAFPQGITLSMLESKEEKRETRH